MKMHDEEHEDEGVTFEYDVVDFAWHVPIDTDDLKYYLAKFKPKPTLDKFQKTLDLLEKNGLLEKKDGKYHCTAKGKEFRREPYPLK